MKKIHALPIAMILGCLILLQSVKAQTIRTVGGSGANYTTLKLAFDAINAGTLTGAITLQITGSTTETASAVLNSSGTGSAVYTSVTVYPTGTGFSISGNLAAPLISLNGADNVVIDGRVNAAGTGKDLVITNTSSASTTGTSTIRFINDATTNTLKYCTLKGSTTDPAAGIVFLSTSAVTVGNDGNTIDNNNITNSTDANRPVNAIYSAGTIAKENSGNTFSNNNIYDFLNRSTVSCGINIGSYTTDETIKGNNFFETAPFLPAASVAYNIIQINNSSGINFTVSDNNIGGTAALCGGTSWTKTEAFDNVFNAISINAGTSALSSIQNNTIRNFSWSNSAGGAWAGISISGGAINIGTTTGNTIGASTGTGSVFLCSTSQTVSYGIYINGTGNVTIAGNTIGSVTTQTFAQNAHSFIGIYKNTNRAGSLTINNNFIGSTATGNSIQAASVNLSSPAQNVYGIFISGTGANTITGNVIANLYDAHAYQYATNGQVAGICTTAGVNTIQNNTIRDLSTTSPNNNTDLSASIIGISQTGPSPGQIISGNTIYSLNSLYTNGRPVSVIGINFAGGSTTNTINNNFIHSFSISATAPNANNAIFTGIRITTGTTAFANNIINLGVGITSGSTIYGIYESGPSGSNYNFYFNTVYIGGTPATGASNSYALYSAASTNTRNYRNNILVNARSNSGSTGKHYAAYFNYAVSTYLTLDYNDYFSPGTGGVLGFYNSTDVAALPIITGFDARSLSINPVFAMAGGTTATNYIPSCPVLDGTPVSTVPVDYLSVPRAGTPTMELSKEP